MVRWQAGESGQGKRTQKEGEKEKDYGGERSGPEKREWGQTGSAERCSVESGDWEGLSGHAGPLCVSVCACMCSWTIERLQEGYFAVSKHTSCTLQDLHMNTMEHICFNWWTGLLLPWQEFHHRYWSHCIWFIPTVLWCRHWGTFWGYWYLPLPSGQVIHSSNIAYCLFSNDIHLYLCFK